MPNNKKRRSERPPKETNVLDMIRTCVKEGRFTGTEHSIIRSNERRIEALDIVEVIENGYHEKNKDEYREDFQSWNYAIRGKTIDGDELRVAVFFKDDAVVVATVIRL